jgi:hypothetical protein
MSRNNLAQAPSYDWDVVAKRFMEVYARASG